MDRQALLDLLQQCLCVLVPLQHQDERWRVLLHDVELCSRFEFLWVRRWRVLLRCVEQRSGVNFLWVERWGVLLRDVELCSGVDFHWFWIHLQSYLGRFR